MNLTHLLRVAQDDELTTKIARCTCCVINLRLSRLIVSIFSLSCCAEERTREETNVQLCMNRR